MRIEIRQRDRRALVTLGVAVLIYLAFSQVALPAYDRLTEAGQAARQKEADLVRYRQAAGRDGAALGAIADVEQASARLGSRLIAAESPNSASVQLQAILEAAAEDAGIVLLQRSASPGRDLADGAYREIAMGLNFQAVPGELGAFLSRIRADRTHLAVTRLQVTAIDTSTEVPEDGILGRGLQVTMTVSAVMPVGPPAEGESGEDPV